MDFSKHWQITAEPADGARYRPVLIQPNGEASRLYGLARKSFRAATKAAEKHMEACMPGTPYVTRSH